MRLGVRIAYCHSVSGGIRIGVGVAARTARAAITARTACLSRRDDSIGIAEAETCDSGTGTRRANIGGTIAGAQSETSRAGEAIAAITTVPPLAARATSAARATGGKRVRLG